MAALDFLFGSSVPSTFTAATENQTNYPAWYQDAQRGLIAKASGIANEPYTPYSGPRIAGLDPLQQQAIGNAADAGTAGGSTLNSAASTAGGASTLFDQNQFNQFMSPYTNGVVDRIAQLGQRNLSENLLPQVNQSFIGSGMPFGSRHADFTNRAVRDANESILGQQATALQQAQQQAMSDYQGALQRQGQVAGIQGAIGTAQTQNDVQAGGFQQLMGAIPQELQQQNLNTAYGDFQNQQNYPAKQLDYINSILKGYSPYQSVTNTQNTTNAANQPTGQQTALGALGQFFGSK